MSWTTKRYCFDIDGTICTNTWGEYEDAEPFFDRIKIINELYEKGNHIIYFTARGMGRCGTLLHIINLMIGDVSFIN